MDKITYKTFRKRISAGCALVCQCGKEIAAKDLPLKLKENEIAQEYAKVILRSNGFKREIINSKSGENDYSYYWHTAGTEYFTIGEKYLVVSKDMIWLIYAIPQDA